MTHTQKYKIKVAGIGAALFLVITTLFQIIIAAGAPVGKISWGGAYDGVLPDNLRVISGVFAVIYTALIFVVLRRAGLIARAPIPDAWISPTFCYPYSLDMFPADHKSCGT